MKRAVKIGVISSLFLASTQMFAIETLASAFEEGKVTGEIKSQYFQKEVADKKVSIWTNGGNLSYKTASFYGLNAGVTLQASTVTADDLDNAPTAYNSDQNVSGAILSEAYLGYTQANTTAKIGRQYISTPLIEGSGSRIFKESYEGIVLSNTDLSNTKIIAAYIDKHQYRTDIASGGDDVKAVSEFKQVGDGAYTLYVKNNSLENLTFEAQYAQINEFSSIDDDVKAFYATASYNWKPYTLETQTYQTNNGQISNSDGKAYAINLMADFDKLSLGAAYSTIDDEASIVSGLGNGADYLYTASWIYGGVYSADTDAYKLSTGYDITTDLSFDVIYASWKTADALRASETDFVTTYAFNKNLSTTFVLATYDKLADESYRSRLYASYKF